VEPEVALVKTNCGTTYGPYDGYGRCGMYDYNQDGYPYEPAMWHKYCYDRATPQEQNDLSESDYAPNQGFGEPQKRFC
jgi:hypothetical protein